MVVGRTLGWHLLKSTDFTVRRTSGGYRFDGKGFGHGVGMCVLGSVRRAEHGDSAREILRAYYPGLEIGRLRESPAAPKPKAAVATVATSAREAPVAREIPVALGLTVQLPAGAEPERGALTDFARRALADLSRATGRPAPAGLHLVFHPSADSFRRETGEPWWTAARTSGVTDRLARRRQCFASAAPSSPRAARTGARVDGAGARGAGRVGEGGRRDALRRGAAACLSGRRWRAAAREMPERRRPAASGVGRIGPAGVCAGRRLRRACARSTAHAGVTSASPALSTRRLRRSSRRRRSACPSPLPTRALPATRSPMPVTISERVTARPSQAMMLGHVAFEVLVVQPLHPRHAQRGRPTCRRRGGSWRAARRRSSSRPRECGGRGRRPRTRRGRSARRCPPTCSKTRRRTIRQAAAGCSTACDVASVIVGGLGLPGQRIGRPDVLEAAAGRP